MGPHGQLPSEACRRREWKRHAYQRVSISKNGKNLFWDPKGEEKMSKFALAVSSDPNPDSRKRYLPAAQLQRQFVPPSGSALRSSEPDQGFGCGSRLDDPYSDREVKRLARRSAFGLRRMPTPTW
jgi:hypothetical protein